MFTGKYQLCRTYSETDKKDVKDWSNDFTMNF